MEVSALDGRAYAKFVTAGAYFLHKYRQVLNDLNVFPVPDGDTGTNMYLTVRQAALEAGKQLAAREAGGQAGGGLAEVAAAAAQGALMGARGNSGVILSQMLRGFAHHVRHRASVDTFMFATGLREGVQAARAALVRPVEGTILSVADAAAEAAYKLALHESDFYRLLSGVVRVANEALERTPDQLPILREAGVVDAGGAGFVYFMEAWLRFLPEVRIPATAFPRRPARSRVFTPQQSVGRHKFCTEFLLAQADCTVHHLRELLQEHGESLIVAGEPPTIKVHIHTDDPQNVQRIAEQHGRCERVKVENMEQQHHLLLIDRPQTTYSIVSIVPGAGFEQIAKELGSEVVLRSEGENPSVREIALAINKALAERVYVFVNDRNAVLAAKEAAALSERDVRVIPTGDIVAGIAGLFAARGAPEAPDEAQLLLEAERTRSARLFIAGKDAALGGTSVSRGKPAAASGGSLYANGGIASTAQAVLRAMGAQDGGLITVYYGGAQKERDAQRLAQELQRAFLQAQVEYYYGGQRADEYWMSLDA